MVGLQYEVKVAMVKAKSLYPDITILYFINKDHLIRRGFEIVWPSLSEIGQFTNLPKLHLSLCTIGGNK